MASYHIIVVVIIIIIIIISSLSSSSSSSSSHHYHQHNHHHHIIIINFIIIIIIIFIIFIISSHILIMIIIINNPPPPPTTLQTQTINNLVHTFLMSVGKPQSKCALIIKHFFWDLALPFTQKPNIQTQKVYHSYFTQSQPFLPFKSKYCGLRARRVYIYFSKMFH